MYRGLLLKFATNTTNKNSCLSRNRRRPFFGLHARRPLTKAARSFLIDYGTIRHTHTYIQTHSVITLTHFHRKRTTKKITVFIPPERERAPGKEAAYRPISCADRRKHLSKSDQILAQSVLYIGTPPSVCNAYVLFVQIKPHTHNIKSERVSGANIIFYSSLACFPNQQ
jgi:hypothetical protein